MLRFFQALSSQHQRVPARAAAGAVSLKNLTKPEEVRKGADQANRV